MRLALALALAVLGVLVYFFALRPAREEAAAAAAALGAAQRAQHDLRARVAAATSRRDARRGGQRTVVSVRRDVVLVLGASGVRDLRMSVRPGSNQVEVRVTGVAGFDEASRLPSRLVEGADLVLTRVACSPGAGGAVRVEVNAVVAQ